MRTFKECKELFDLIKQVDFGDCDVTVQNVAFRIKWLACMAKELYGEYVKDFCDYFLNEQGQLMESDSYSMEDVGDYITQTAFNQSYIGYYALIYMDHSPYWETSMEWCGMDFSEEGEIEKELPFYEFLEKRFGTFLESHLYVPPEEELLSHEHPLYDLYGMFDDYEVADDMCVLKCLLYPYFSKAKKAAGNGFKEHVEYMGQAFSIIKGWLGINNCVVETEKYGYFFLADGSADAYNELGGGTLSFYPEVIICAELIEAAMFEIHEAVPFLPQELVVMRKEEKND